MHGSGGTDEPMPEVARIAKDATVRELGGFDETFSHLVDWDLDS
jgi:hypothetical protein